MNWLIAPLLMFGILPVVVHGWPRRYRQNMPADRTLRYEIDGDPNSSETVTANAVSSYGDTIGYLTATLEHNEHGLTFIVEDFWVGESHRARGVGQRLYIELTKTLNRAGARLASYPEFRSAKSDHVHDALRKHGEINVQHSRGWLGDIDVYYNA